ncbi:MAG TPA: ATP-binding protein [Candidatus Polarisedimenticolia bacterium]|nr:ATP-binding protein [Candidatus Polarisedimenticolia bacterium]
MRLAPTRTLKSLYLAALRDHLAGAGEAPLSRAYDLGRRALGEGIGVLGLTALHAEAVGTILRERRPAVSRARLVSGSGAFLAESLSPFEMTHRGYEEAVEALRRMNQRLEDEARRIAHALHDDAGQLLVTVHLALESATAELPGPLSARFDHVRRLLGEVEQHLRRMSHELRPTILDDLGLIPALEFLARGLEARSGVAVRVSGPARPRLAPAVETALYRVVQEALHNALRHARPDAIDVRLERVAATMRLTVRDDGRGFDPAAARRRRGARGLGLIAMRERLDEVGGRLAIDSKAGRGTEIRISIPWEEGRDADTAALGR